MHAAKGQHVSNASRFLGAQVLHYAACFAKAVLVYVLSFVLATQPLLAQTAQVQADANANAANRPNVGAAANGVPLVNIVKPNAAGLSHNKYQQFNVGTPGLILNNSNANVANSQLGGLVQGNANLRLSGPARVILNEVTGASRSQLRGTVEVHGSRADVIIANPNGITCNGCGFINTPRVTLSTGTPEIGTGGNLLSLHVNGGDIVIGENGADLASVSVFDIVSRGVSVQGPVKAGGALNLIAGRNSYAYQTGLITPLASDGNEPAIAIDSSLFGGMYVGRIKLISTDKGAGVNMQGQMAANAEAMTLSADGKLTLRKARAKGKITATARDVEVQDTLFSDDAIELRGVSGVRINDHGFVGAQNDVTITGDQVAIGAGSVVAAGTDEAGTLGTSGALRVTASTLTAGGGELVGAGSLAVSAALIDLTRGTDTGAASLRSLATMTLQTERIDAQNNRVTAGGTLNILAAHGLTLSEGFYASASALLVDAPAITSSATLRSAATVTLRGTAGDVINTGVVAGDTGTTVTASRDITNSGEIQSNAAVTVAAGGTLTNQASGQIVGVTGNTVTAAALDNRGKIGADGGTLAVNVTGNADNAGTLFSGGTAVIRLDGRFTNSGIISADSPLLVEGLRVSHAGHFANLAGAEINVSAPSFFVTSLANEGLINAHTGGIVLDSTGDVSNAGAISSKSDAELRVDGNLTNSGTMTGEGTLTLAGRGGGRSGTLTTTASSLVNGTNGLTIRGTSVANAGEVGSASGPLLVELSGSLDNAGLIYSGTWSAFHVDGDVTNTGGDIISETDITIRGLSHLRTGRVANRSANIEAIAGDVSITATSLDNTRSQYTIGTTSSSTTHQSGATTTTTTVTREVLDSATSPSRLLAGGDILIDTSGAVTNTYSQIAASGDITIDATNVTNTGRDLIETTVVTSVTQHSQRYCAKRILGICVNHKTRRWTTTSSNTSSQTYDAAYATIKAGGTLTANVTGYLANDAVRQGAGQIGLTSGDRALNGGNARNADTLSSNDLTGLQVAANSLLGRSALFETITDPNAPFLIETRSRFIDPSQFLGSDYFLGLVGGYNPDLALKRFGDAYAETRLIRDQIFEETGRRLLWDEGDERAQMQRLYDNAVDAQKELGLAYGVALTPEQQANLTQDIVWLEAQTVADQQVLVPRLYLASATRENADLNSARLTANTTALNVGSIANSGRITGWSGIEIDTSGDTANFGGSLTSSADITIRSGGTFDNRSGTIDGQNVSIAAANIINSTAVTRDTWFNGYTDRAHQIARIKAQGTLEIDSSGSYEAIGSETTAGGDLTIRAGDTVTIAALGLEAWRDDKIDGGYDRESSLTNRKATVTAGGNVTITGNGDVGLAGADVEAGGDATITSETGNVTIASVQDTRSSSLRLTIESGGFLGTKTEIERDSANSTTQASTIKAGNNVKIASTTQNVTIQASEIESGGQTTLSAEQGQVALLANKDTDFAQDKKREEDIGWWNSRDQGHNRETVQHVKIDAEGGLKIVAGQGVIAEIEATGSLDGAITQLSEKSGMAWVGQLRERNDVEWRKIKPALEEWDYKAQGLTEAGAALVALAVTAISAGTLTQLSTFIASALPAGMQSAATTAALKAGMTSLVTRASVSMINNGGDLGAVLKELGSSGSLKALATAMLSAGLTAGITPTINEALGAVPGPEATLAVRVQDQLTRGLTTGIVRSAIHSGVSTAVNGGSFNKAFASSLKNLAVNQVLSATHTVIGDFTDGMGANDLPVANIVAHALAGGLAAEATGGKFEAGAAAALASVVAAQTGLFEGLSREQIGLISRVIGGTAAFLADGDADDVNQGAEISQSAALNNYLKHDELREFKAKFADCKGNKNCETKLVGLFQNKSLENLIEMQACGYDNACLHEHLKAMAKAGPEAYDWDGQYNRHDDLSQLFNNEADMLAAIGKYQYNEYLTEQCGTATTSCDYKEIAKNVTWTVVDFIPVVGDLKGFADAISSGAPLDYVMAVTGIVPIGDLAKLGKLSKAGKLNGLTRTQFDEMTAGMQLTKAERDQHYIDYVVNGGAANSARPKLTIKDQYAHHKAMTDDLKAQIESQGYRVSDREISFGSSCGTGRCRPDVVYETPDGKIGIIEVKTGNADLTIRQSEIYPQINSGDSIPRGDVARRFGLDPGVPLRDQGYPNGIPIEIRTFPGAGK